MFDLFDKSWEYFKKHGLLLGIFFALICVFLAWLNYLCYPADFWDRYMEVIRTGNLYKLEMLQKDIETSTGKSWIITIIQFFMMIGVTNMALSLVNGTSAKVSMDDFKLSFLHYLKLAEVYFLIILVIVLGMWLYVLPGIFFAIRFSMAIPYLLDHPEEGALQSIRASWKMTKGHFFQIIGFSILCMLIYLIGIICLGIGVFFAHIIVLFAYLLFYKQLSETISTTVHPQQ